MVSIPLRLAVGMLVLIAVPSLAAALGPRRPPHGGDARPTRSGAEQPPVGSAGAIAAAPARSTPPTPPAAPEPGPVPTQHGRLILDGAFARRIGLLAAMRELELPGKAVRHAPADHLLTALVNVLAGHRQLQQISRGPTPLRGDLALAHAWEQEQFPEVSGVC